MFLNLLRPFIYLWAGLNFVDDLSFFMKIARLVGASTFHRRNQNPESICDLCDDVVANLLIGSDGLEAVPCSWLCLGIPKCTKMCKSIQDVAEKTSDFPCIAAGYCIAEDEEVYTGFADEVDCKKGPLFSCEPKKFCRKKRHGFKYTCDLKPGVGRWIHMKKAAHQHATAMALGILEPTRCGDPGAGPYCIAIPSGFGRISEYLAWFLSILYGGYASTVAIETPGGDDDQQWLTFWVMFVLSMFLEHTFARVLLSRFPLYYHFKLAFIVWLIFFDGAATVYRWLRTQMAQLSPFFANMLDDHNQCHAQIKLNSIVSIGGALITDRIDILEQKLKYDHRKRNSQLFSNSCEAESFWEYDYTDTKLGRTSLVVEERLYQISKWLLSREGLQEIENMVDSNTAALLLERAAAVISFQPKFLNIHLISTKPGAGGRLPPMDQNGKADPYIKFSFVADRGFSLKSLSDQNHSEGRLTNVAGMTNLTLLNQTVTSRIAYRTIEPHWNQILEMPIRGGMLGKDGIYRNHEIKETMLLVEAWDADCGKWGIALQVFRLLGYALACLFVVAYTLGTIDFVFNEKLSTVQWWWKTTMIVTTMCVALGISSSWIMSEVLRADDEFIGSSGVPLDVLTDRRGHSLILKLRKMGEERGILRVKLSLSES